MRSCRSQKRQIDNQMRLRSIVKLNSLVKVRMKIQNGLESKIKGICRSQKKICLQIRDNRPMQATLILSCMRLWQKHTLLEMTLMCLVMRPLKGEMITSQRSNFHLYFKSRVPLVLCQGHFKKGRKTKSQCQGLGKQEAMTAIKTS